MKPHPVPAGIYDMGSRKRPAVLGPVVAAPTGPSAATLRAAILASGPTHFYEFTSLETSGVDQSGNGWDTTIPNNFTGPFPEGGPLDSYLNMSGFQDAFDRTEAGAGEDLNPDQLTVEMIVHVPSNARAWSYGQRLLAGNDAGSGSSRPWVMVLTNAGTFQAFANNQYGPVLTATSEIDDGDFHHLVFTHDWSTGLNNLYVDGVREVTDGTGSTSKQTNDQIAFGSQRAAVNEWQGGLVLGAFYDRVLTPAEVTEHFANVVLDDAL